MSECKYPGLYANFVSKLQEQYGDEALSSLVVQHTKERAGRRWTSRVGEKRASRLLWMRAVRAEDARRKLL